MELSRKRVSSKKKGRVFMEQFPINIAITELTVI